MKDDWYPIQFEGVELHPSATAMSILINENALTEGTLDWLWKLTNCRGVMKSASTETCEKSSEELVDFIKSHGADSKAEIAERLEALLLEANQTYADWLHDLQVISQLSKSSKSDECSWISHQK